MEDEDIKKRLAKYDDWKRSDAASEVTSDEERTEQVHQTMPEEREPVLDTEEENGDADDGR